jgi:acetyl esterase
MPLETNQIVHPPSMHKPNEILGYKTAEGAELRAHIFTPAGPAARSAFVFFHPGGWGMGAPDWGYDICHHYASLGMLGISFQYRLSSAGGYTPLQAVRDARSALRWTRANADSLGVDEARLVAGGVSAGGHLAACAAILDGPDDRSDNVAVSARPNALVLQCSPMNPTINPHFLALLKGADKPENLSPIHHVRAGLPPMCMVQGTADVIVSYDSIKEFATKMREAGNRCDLHTFEGADHFFSNPADQQRAMKEHENFLAELGYLHTA